MGSLSLIHYLCKVKKFIQILYTLPSKLLENAVSELARLPGIGRKTALRMALQVLKWPADDVERFGKAITVMRNELVFCSQCGNIADAPLCSICSDARRDASIVCIVEDIRDVMAIENTGQFTGVYHVLGGIISPMDGVGPTDLNIDTLLHRVSENGIREIILALPATIEGDTTNFYLFRKLQTSSLRISMIARGVNIGDELEHTDEITLGRSILNRTLYEGMR